MLSLSCCYMSLVHIFSTLSREPSRFHHVFSQWESTPHPASIASLQLHTSTNNRLVGTAAYVRVSDSAVMFHQRQVASAQR